MNPQCQGGSNIYSEKVIRPFMHCSVVANSSTIQYTQTHLTHVSNQLALESKDNISGPRANGAVKSHCLYFRMFVRRHW